MTGEPELELTTFDGSLDVRAWDRDEVLVQIEKRAPTEAEASALEVRVTNEGNRIRVEAVQPVAHRDWLVLPPERWRERLGIAQGR